MTRRWLFADQLGSDFLVDPDQPVLLVEARAVFRRRRFHRQKAHLLLSALRHRAVELGDQAELLQVDTYGEALACVREPLSVVQPTSWSADRYARTLLAAGTVTDIADHPHFLLNRSQFAEWVQGRRRLLLEDFYRDQRRRTGLLMEGSEPVGGRWNLDADNREPPPKSPTLGLPEPWWPEEDDIDAEVRADLDRWERDGQANFVGRDGPRWAPATQAEARHALERFITARLSTFGPHEDAMLAADPVMSHSVLSPAMNLGLVGPLQAAQAAEEAYRRGDAPLAGVEGYIRQLIGWREYIWQVYWHFGTDYRERNYLQATQPLPQWFAELDADHVDAACLSDVLAGVRDRGWVHHIPRLMVLGNWALQRGYSPAALTDWFHEVFVDGYAWVMAANVIGMSQHADGGAMATKPYASGGAYINRMSDYCAPCRYRPQVRVGKDACPFTAGYWWFLDRNAERLAGNNRMSRALAGRHRLADLEHVIEQEQHRGSDAP